MGKVSQDDHITILNLRKTRKLSVRCVADITGHSPTTVQKYANIQPDDKPFNHCRASMFDGYKDEIEAILNAEHGKQSHNVKTAMYEFRKAHPRFEFGKSAFYDFVARKCMRIREPKLARIPLDHSPGDAQIDFCEVAYYRHGRRINGHQFTMSFPYSNVSFVQIFPAENQQCLFEAMANIFEFIGFVPIRVTFDNATTAVLTLRKKGIDAQPSPEYAAFSSWYGFEAVFCNPASGWEKGCVERNNAVKRKAYFTPPPIIDDENDFNRELLQRCLDDASKAKHYLKGEYLTDLFDADRAAGNALPKDRIDCRKCLVRKTDRCGMIQLFKSRYSVSDKHPQKTVMVKVGAFTVDIYDEFGNFICSHRRSYRDGSVIIDKTMYADALAARPRAQIKQSDDGILTGFEQTINSVRPAERENAFVDFMERNGINQLESPTKHAMVLYNLVPFNSDVDAYDLKIKSNRSLVQTASAGRSVCRGRSRQEKP